MIEVNDEMNDISECRHGNVRSSLTASVSVCESFLENILIGSCQWWAGLTGWLDDKYLHLHPTSLNSIASLPLGAGGSKFNFLVIQTE